MSNTSGFLSSLSLGTIVVVLLVVGVAFLWFMRRRSNRHPTEGLQDRNIARDLDAGREAPDHLPRE